MSEESIGSDKPVILVVDDDRGFRLFMQTNPMMKDVWSQCEVITAESPDGADATLAELESSGKKPAAVILDHQMHTEKTGGQWLKEQRQNPDSPIDGIPVIMHTDSAGTLKSTHASLPGTNLFTERGIDGLNFIKKKLAELGIIQTEHRGSGSPGR